MIRFDQVSKMYKGTAKPALDSIDLEILRGEFVFLVGASGSGKSSFLRLILKEDKPTKGDIHVLGQHLGSISSRKVPYFRRNLGVVFQDFRLLPNKSVYDNVAFTLQVIGKSRGFIQEAVPDVLQMVGLNEKANRLPHELSGGEQQRVAIARAVVNKPAILLADEPTGNLDPVTSVGIMNVLDRINAGGTTVIMATHDNAIVDQMQRRVIELVGGHVVRDELQGGYGITTEIALEDSGMTAEITRPDIARNPQRPATGVLPVQTTGVPVTQGRAAQAEPGSTAAPSVQPTPVVAEAANAAAAPTPSDAPAAAPGTVPAWAPAARTSAAVLPESWRDDLDQDARARAASAGPDAAPAPSGPPASPTEPAEGEDAQTGPASAPAASQSAPTTATSAILRPRMPDEAVTEQLSLAERLGLRAAGESAKKENDQNVGRTTS